MGGLKSQFDPIWLIYASKMGGLNNHFNYTSYIEGYSIHHVSPERVFLFEAMFLVVFVGWFL